LAIEGSRGVKLDKHGEFTFEVPGQPATKKNSPVLVMGRAVVLPSKAYKTYEKLFHKHLELLRAKWGALPHFEGPVSLEVKYYLQDRRAYPDLNGLIQATQDILADEYSHKNHTKTLKREWILADDRLVKSLDGCRIAGIDKANPRAEITITPLEIDPERETDPYIIRKVKETMQTGLKL